MITQKGAVHNNVIWPTFGASGVVVTVRMFLVFLVVMLLVMIVLVFMFFVVVMFVRMIRRALEVKRFVW